MKTTLHLHRPVAPVTPAPPAPRLAARASTLRLGLVVSLVAAVVAIVVEAVLHLPAVLVLIPVVVIGFALSWRASGPEDVPRRP